MQMFVYAKRAQGTWLVGWYWKASFMASYLQWKDSVILNVRLYDNALSLK